jgi:1-deoxy-D-xylulose-5-phosphate synthase
MNIIVPNILFEDLGFKYVGPIDGHDIPRLCRIFKKIKENMEGPVLLHLVTKKGKGSQFAESKPSKYHGVGPYDYETGVTPAQNEKSWSEVFGDRLVELAEKNDKIVAVTAAMGDGTGLQSFEKKFPDKFFDVGIAEQHAVTFSAGMAIKGLRPFVAIYSSFLQRAVDQIIHDVALQKLPVVFCIDRAGLVGEDGATHHGVFDLSYLQFIPNLTIISPANIKDMEDALEWSLTHIDGPIAIRYPRGIASTCEHPHTFEYAKANVLSVGTKIAITGVGTSLQIAKKLHNLMSVTSDAPADTYSHHYLINPVFIKPYDTKLYDKIYKTCKYHIVIEENAQIGGFASRLMTDYALSKCKTLSYAVPDKFVTHGETEMLRETIDLTAEKIYEKVKDIII